MHQVGETKFVDLRQPALTLRSHRNVVEFRDATLAVGVGGLDARALLPTLPVGIQEFEALIEWSSIHRELRERDRGCERDVCKSGFFATE